MHDWFNEGMNAVLKSADGRIECSKESLERPSGMLKRYWPLRREPPTVRRTAGWMPSAGAVMSWAFHVG